MTSSEIESKIRRFVGQNYLHAQGADRLPGSDSFLEKGIVDSTGILEMIAFLESEFGVKVEDEELVPENLDSVDGLVGFVARKLLARA
jgi:acyl carrier protein